MTDPRLSIVSSRITQSVCLVVALGLCTSQAHAQTQSIVVQVVLPDGSKTALSGDFHQLLESRSPDATSCGQIWLRPGEPLAEPRQFRIVYPLEWTDSVGTRQFNLYRGIYAPDVRARIERLSIDGKDMPCGESDIQMDLYSGLQETSPGTDLQLTRSDAADGESEFVVGEENSWQFKLTNQLVSQPVTIEAVDVDGGPVTMAPVSSLSIPPRGTHLFTWTPTVGSTMTALRRSLRSSKQSQHLNVTYHVWDKQRKVVSFDLPVMLVPTWWMLIVPLSVGVVAGSVLRGWVAPAAPSAPVAVASPEAAAAAPAPPPKARGQIRDLAYTLVAASVVMFILEFTNAKLQVLTTSVDSRQLFGGLIVGLFAGLSGRSIVELLRLDPTFKKVFGVAA